MKLLQKDWYKTVEPLQNTPLKLHSSTQLKSVSELPVLTKNSAGQLSVFTSRNKDVKKPVILYDVITGVEQAENPDDLAFNLLAPMNGVGSGSNDLDEEEGPGTTIKYYQTLLLK